MPETSDLARRFAALAALGFERVEDTAVKRNLYVVDGSTCRVEQSRPAMGTLVSISALVDSSDRADAAIGAALEEMDRLIEIFSRFDDGSAVTELNATGRLSGPPRELLEVLGGARRFHEITRGGFDISVAPVVELFRAAPPGQLPDEAEVQEALELIGAERIELSERRVGFGRQGMCMTLDGIAKGYIVDAVARQLEEHRIRNYLVEAGGDIRARGSRGHARPWMVAVRDPESGRELADRIELLRGAVATSGSYEQYYDEERKHHHIVHADSGASPQHSSSVTVVAPTAMAADALATSVFLMAPDDGVRFIDSLPDSECFVIAHDGTRFKSRGWQSVAPEQLQ